MIQKSTESFSKTPLQKHKEVGNVYASNTGITPVLRNSFLTYNLGFPDVSIPRKGSIPFGKHWVDLLMNNATGRHTPFGVTMTTNQVETLISNIPLEPISIPKTTLETSIDSEIFVSDNRWAVPTVSGWKFKAGIVLKARRQVWIKACSPQVAPKIRDILTEGWNPPTDGISEPVWFQDHTMTKDETVVWDREVTTLLQMGSIKQITQQHVRQHGLPQVVLPIFLVEEKDKFRPIIDARFSNITFLPPWFPLPDIEHFMAQLTKDTFWFKCDIKGGWHHIPIHQYHSNFFAFHWKGKLFQYLVCPFGDATAPYCFTYLLITLKRMLRARGFKNFTLYIDDLLMPGSTNQRLSSQREQVINLQLQLNLVLGAKKCPPPSKSGEALGFWIDTQLGIITFTPQKLAAISELALEIQNTWGSNKKVPVKRLASLLGKIISGKILFSQTIGLLHDLLSLLAASTANNEWDSFVCADPSMINSVFTWIKFVKSYPRRLWFAPQKTIYFSSDATLQAASAVFWGFFPEFHPNSTAHTPVFQAYTLDIPNSENIAAIEGFAIIWGLQTFLQKVLTWLHDKNLSPSDVTWVWATDNQVCEAAFNKGRSLEPLVHQFSQQTILEVVLPLGVHISFPYIPSKINFQADSLSRLSTQGNWAFSNKYFSSFMKYCVKHHLPLPTCDALATKDNSLLPQYHSRFLDSLSLGDFFSTFNRLTVYWVNPTSDMVEETVKFIVAKEITAWILLPVWPAASWWKYTRLASFQYDVKFQPGWGPICVSPNSFVKNFYACFWKIFLFQVS